MPVYDMACPKCGKQATEYDENKWRCLHCGNKFIYKEERPSYEINTTVNIESSALFDVETDDTPNNRPYEEPYLKCHNLDDDTEIQAARELKRASKIGIIFTGSFLLPLGTIVGLSMTGFAHPFGNWMGSVLFS